MLPVAINLILALCSASVNGWKVLEHHFTSVVGTDSPHHFLVALNYFSISLLCFTTVEKKKKKNRSQVTYKCSYKLSHFADPTSISTSSIDQIDHCISHWSALTLERERGWRSCSSWSESCPAHGWGNHNGSDRLTDRSKCTSRSTTAGPLCSGWNAWKSAHEQGLITLLTSFKENA